MSIDVKQMVVAYLKEHLYDGLCCNDDCGCGVDDLAPCGECMIACTAARKGTDGLYYEIKTERDKITPCPDCGSTNIKCRGIIFNCEDCGARW